MSQNTNHLKKDLLLKLLEEESNLGVLDELIDSKIACSNPKLIGSYYEKVFVKLQEDRIIEFGLYKNIREYPIVLDHVKKLFKVYRTRYYHTQIEGMKYLARLCINEISLEDYLKFFINYDPKNPLIKIKMTEIGLRPSFVNEIQRIISFNWIMCVATVNIESKIYVRCLNPTTKITSDNFKEIVVYPFTCNEREYSKDITACDISDKTLMRWFSGSRELFYENIKKLMREIDIERFKVVFECIIQKINPLLSPWVNVVYNRMKSIQYLSVDEEEESEED